MAVNPFWIFTGFGIAGYIIPVLLTRNHPRRNRVIAQVVGALILIVGAGVAATYYSP